MLWAVRLLHHYVNCTVCIAVLTSGFVFAVADATSLLSMFSSLRRRQTLLAEVCILLYLVTGFCF